MVWTRNINTLTCTRIRTCTYRNRRRHKHTRTSTYTGLQQIVSMPNRETHTCARARYTDTHIQTHTQTHTNTHTHTHSYTPQPHIHTHAHTHRAFTKTCIKTSGHNIFIVLLHHLPLISDRSEPRLLPWQSYEKLPPMSQSV